jgi:hypothetical protein
MRFAEFITTGDIERRGIPKRVYEYVASHEIFQFEQFTLVNLERDAAAQAEGAVQSSGSVCRVPREWEQRKGDDVLRHVFLVKVKAGAVSRERLHEHALIGYRTRIDQSAVETRGEARPRGNNAAVQ